MTALTVEDLPLVRLVGQAALSPDGRTAAYVDAGYDLDGDESTWSVWLVATDGSGEPRRLTSGRQDSTPRWSPDGTAVAYLAAGPAAWRQDLHVVDAGTGELREVIAVGRGVQEFAWSPDGSGFAVTARVAHPDDPQRPPARDEQELLRRYASRVIHVRGGQYRGYSAFEPDEQPQLWWAPRGGEPERLTDFAGPVSAPGFTPDGRLAFVGSRAEQWQRSAGARIWAVGRDGSGLTSLTDDVVEPRGFAFSGRGELVWVAQPGSEVSFGSHDPRLFVDGKDVSDALDRPTSRASEVQSLTVDYLTATSGPVAADDGAVYVHVVDAGSAHIYRWADDTLAPVLTGRRVIGDVSVAAGRVLFTMSGEELANGLLVATAGEGAEGERVLVDPNPWLREREVGEVRHLPVTLDTGEEMDVWTVLPAGYDGTPLPTILEIHAGPHSSFPWDFHLEHRMWANAGFAVVVCNQVGSQGYGEEFARRLDGHWGEADQPHYLLACETAAAAGLSDPERVGVTGLTYGALAALWLAAHTDRFKAVVTNRAMSDLTAMYADSDIGDTFLPALLRAEPWEDPELYRRLSPVTYATQITAPTRLLAFDGNGRTTVAASEAIYRRLHKLGVETDMLVFPPGAATVFHPNKPWSKWTMTRATLEWFQQHL